MARVLLAPTADLARRVLASDTVLVTVEAEYGAFVAPGAVYTAAHHQPEMVGRPAPCCDTTIPDVSAEDGVILLSHLDLDSVGGALRALGRADLFPRGLWEPNAEAAAVLTDNDIASFWALAQFIDINGAHHAHEHPAWAEHADQFRAYWAWSQSRPRTPFGEVTDITEEVEEHNKVLFTLLIEGPEEESFPALLAAGREWANRQEAINRASLVDAVRTPSGYVLLRHADTFVNTMYNFGGEGKVAKAIVALNTKTGAITVSHDGAPFVAREFVQGIWGPEAGGHAGIAGSPRGEALTAEDARAAFDALLAKLGA